MGKQAFRHKPRSGIVAVLDVGTTKVCCLIAKLGDAGIDILGVGHQVSHGVRGGVIVDMELAESAIRSAVEAAEHMARETVSQIAVTVTGGNPESRLISFEIGIGGHEVDDADIRQLLDPNWLQEQKPPERKLLHTLPISFSIDGNKGVRDPRGMVGERLGANLHMITVDSSAIRNLNSCVSHCHLEVDTEITAPYAAGLGCLIDDEMDLGCTMIDMGGGATGISVFYEGELVYVDSVPLGGQHVTNDVARGLSTTVAHAERIKTLYGSVLQSLSDNDEVIQVPMVGDDEDSADTNQVPRSMLVNIIKPRVEETLEMVRAKLKESKLDRIAGRHIVLTGGASQLTGVREMAGAMLDKQMRIGRPGGVSGLPEATSGPAFSAAAGLLRYLYEKPAGFAIPDMGDIAAPRGRFGKIGQWLRENF